MLCTGIPDIFLPGKINLESKKAAKIPMIVFNGTAIRATLIVKRKAESV
jgi:hypothetical protein